MKPAFLLLLLTAAAFAQVPKPDALSNLRDAIKLLEAEAPPPGVSDSAISRRLEEANAKMLELQKLAVAIELIKKAIAQIEAEKQKTRVVPALPTP